MNVTNLEKFLQELNGSGKEKMDGYTLSYFDNMTDVEKNHEFDLLSQELQSSSVAIDPMFYINKSEACSIFEAKYLTEKEVGQVNFHLVAKLWSCNRSDIYAEAFEKCYNSISEYSLIAYINDASTIDHRKSKEVLVKIILDSDKGHVRRHAAKALVLKTKITDEVEKRQFVNSVVVDNRQDRKLALENRIINH